MATIDTIICSFDFHGFERRHDAFVDDILAGEVTPDAVVSLILSGTYDFPTVYNALQEQVVDRRELNGVAGGIGLLALAGATGALTGPGTAALYAVGGLGVGYVVGRLVRPVDLLNQRGRQRAAYGARALAALEAHDHPLFQTGNYAISNNRFRRFDIWSRTSQERALVWSLFPRQVPHLTTTKVYCLREEYQEPGEDGPTYHQRNVRITVVNGKPRTIEVVNGEGVVTEYKRDRHVSVPCGVGIDDEGLQVFTSSLAPYAQLEVSGFVQQQTL